MQDATNTREKILKKIRKALIHKAPVNYLNTDMDMEVFAVSQESPEVEFAANFTALQGQFIYCSGQSELAENLKLLLRSYVEVHCVESSLIRILQQLGISYNVYTSDSQAAVALTFCECLVARTGSIVVSAAQASGRRLPFIAPTHVVIAYTSQLVSNIKQAFDYIREKHQGQMPAMITHISGPSRTADIEQTLVTGVHGPQQLYCLLVEDQL